MATPMVEGKGRGSFGPTRFPRRPLPDRELRLSHVLERNALTGRHRRFSEVEFGASWDELARTADRFPSSSTTVGLGRSFAWNQWARVNRVVDENFRVRRGPADRARFLALADQLRDDGNALDARAAA